MNKIETAMSFFQDKDSLQNRNPNRNSQINKEFKNMVLANIQENYQVSLDKSKEESVFEEVDRLSSLVETKRPELGDLEKLTMLDEMFHVKFNIDSFRDSSGSNDLDIG